MAFDRREWRPDQRALATVERRLEPCDDIWRPISSCRLADGLRWRPAQRPALRWGRRAAILGRHLDVGREGVDAQVTGRRRAVAGPNGFSSRAALRRARCAFRARSGG